MIYKNIEIYNAAELKVTDEGVEWLRFPKEVADSLEADVEQRQATNCTGVELRFVLEGEAATIKLKRKNADGNRTASRFHIYRGGIQGGWEDSEISGTIYGDYEERIIRKEPFIDELKKVSQEIGSPWSPEVVRVIFDIGRYCIIGIDGDIRPPRADECPKRTILNYGSSITHGSNALDASHNWASVVAHNLRADCRNLGMAGSCVMEKEVIDYIAKEGKDGKWDVAVMELGINVLGWQEDKIRQRAEYAVKTVAAENAEKPIFIISPFYCADINDPEHRADIWREILSETVEKLNLKNVTLINGLELLGDVSLLSADLIHPNIYGVSRIAENLTERMSGVLRKI